MGGSNWITNSFSLFFFFAQSPYSFVGQERLEKITWQPSFFFTFIFHDCVRLLRWAPVRPFLRNFAMFVLNLMTVSGCGNHIYALACELIILNDPQELHKNERPFFYFLLPCVFYYSIAICIFLSFFFCTWFVFDNGGPEMLGEKVIGISRFSC